jgi:hypothetical protein
MVSTSIYATLENRLKAWAQATGEGTHFLVPWLQRAILYDCRIKPRVSSASTGDRTGVVNNETST